MQYELHIGLPASTPYWQVLLYESHTAGGVQVPQLQPAIQPHWASTQMLPQSIPESALPWQWPW